MNGDFRDGDCAGDLELWVFFTNFWRDEGSLLFGGLTNGAGEVARGDFGTDRPTVSKAEAEKASCVKNGT